MWFDRTMLRVSLVAGSVVGAIVLAKLILVPADRAVRDDKVQPAPPSICQPALDEARRTLTQREATDDSKVAAVERMTRVANDHCRNEAAALTSELARAYHGRAVKEPAMRDYAERL